MEERWPIPIPLHRLRAGTTCTLYALHTAPAMKRRLQDLGLVPGTNIQCLRNPKRCPMLLQVRGTWIALRQQAARLILVQITIST